MFISKISIVPAGCVIIALIIAISHFKDDGVSETAYVSENMIKPTGKEILVHNRAVAWMHVVFAVINIIPIFFFSDIIKIIISFIVLVAGFLAGSLLSYLCNRKNFKKRIKEEKIELLRQSIKEENGKI